MSRKEDRLSHVVQFVDEELLRLGVAIAAEAAAPGVDGQGYKDYAEILDTNLTDLH